MGDEPTFPRSRRCAPLLLAAPAAAGATAAAWAVRPVLPGHADYLDSFTPPYLPAAAAVLAAASILAALFGVGRTPLARSRVGAGAALAVTALLWSAGGLLFDLLRIASLVGGGDFMPTEADWAGLPLRTSALCAALLVAAAGLRSLRAASGACLRCGRAEGTRTAVLRWPAVAAVVAALPYPVVKTLWSLGIDVGLSGDGLFVHDALAWLPVVPALVGVGLSMALAHPEGWHLPRWTLLAAGWFGTVLLATVGLPAGYSVVQTLTVHGPTEPLGGIQVWVYAVFYLSWLLWAPALGTATWNCQQRTRGHCPLCGRKPRPPHGATTGPGSATPPSREDEAAPHRR